jgi:transcription factor C subunit 6
MEPLRRSGRQRKSNTRYAADAFDGLELSGSSSDEANARADDDSEDEFDIEKENKELAEADDDNLSLDEGSDRQASEEDAVVTEDEGLGDGYADKLRKPGAFKGQISRTQRFQDNRKRQAVPSESSAKYDTHSRGVREVIQKSGKHDRRDYTFGIDEEDWGPVSIAMDKWLADTVLPSRKANKSHVGGFAPSWFYTEELQREEASTAWAWLNEEEEADIISSNQVYENLSKQEAKLYLPVSKKNATKVLLGPSERQQLHELGFGKHLSVGEAWRSAIGSGNKSSDEEPITATPEGWIVDVGGRVQCMQWIPHQPGNTQYLSISVLQKHINPTEEFKSRTGQETAPAFARSPPYPDSLQIWAFEGLNEEEGGGGGGGAKPNYNKPPRMEMLLCANWGSIKKFEWCPVPGREAGIDNHNKQRSLGLLAAVWGDGKLRVLDVRCLAANTKEPSRIYASKAAIELELPDTVCTTLCWLSSSSVAAGCANGSVAIWSVPDALSSSSTSSHRPFFYHNLHQSYILHISSGYPTRPYYIATSSMDGYLRLTDIRSPHLDTVLSPRHRIGSPTILWDDHLQAFIAPDETCCVRIYGIRKFYTSVIIAKFSDANTLSLAVSPVHPIVLMGAVDGEVATTNPLRRINDPKMQAYQQPWFIHEWRRAISGAARGNADNHAAASATHTKTSNAHHARQRDNNSRTNPAKSANNAMAEPGSQVVLAEPLTRFTESLEAYHAPLESNPGGEIPEGSSVQTIFEPESSITALAWNPNIRYGGWAAAGMGTGLVRVEDIAV